MQSAIALAVVCGAVLGTPVAGPAAPAVARAQAFAAPVYYPETGHSVGGGFLNFFAGHGGVRVFGYPISDEISENGRTVQYFERQRFEYHPEFKGTANEVLLGRLGTDLGPGKVSFARIAPFASGGGRLYFPQTGHSLSGALLQFWRTNGDVRVLGYPVSEPTVFNGLTVQYLERARLEFHPNKAAAGYSVELGQLGKEYVQAHPQVAQAIAAATRSAQPAGQSPAGGLNARESALLALLNQARKSAGLAPVAVDPAVTKLARSRSADMAARGYFSHQTPEGTDFLAMLKQQNMPYRWAGEIIHMNDFSADLTVQKAYEGLINSPPHRAIILDPHFSLAGPGEAVSANGYYYYTVIFIQR